MSTRRRFIQEMSLLTAGLSVPSWFYIQRSPDLRPQLPSGISAGDVWRDRAIIWSRSDRPARMWIDWSTTESFKKLQTIQGPAALPESDFTTQIDLTGLPIGQNIFYRVRYQSLEDLKLWSEPLIGQLRTAPAAARNIRFQWGGDTCGQGWGINPAIGGMKIYSQMAARNPDFFIHSGDTIYADGPIQAEVKLSDGRIWKNILTEEKSKVAETRQEFQGNYRYNLMDNNLRQFNAQVPILYQWDDHEVLNNWYPEEIHNDPRYLEKNVALLAARAKRAFLDYCPIRSTGDDPERIYRRIPYGPLLDVFMIDMRSYRAANGPNKQSQAGPDTALLGRQQIQWLKEGLLASKASWKVIASDMPLGLIVYDDYINKSSFENGANGPGPALGRELETAELLRFMLHNEIKNVVWLTADVHYCAAHYYDPVKAQFKDFQPFYEFVAGPLNAGTFGPGELDNTFGPQVLFQKAPPSGSSNLSPLDGMQFFGEVNIDAETEVMQVALWDNLGKKLFEQKIDKQ
jgi:alkaline phosphatase D